MVKLPDLLQVATCLEMIQGIVDNHTKRIELLMDNLKHSVEMYLQCLETLKVMGACVREGRKQVEEHAEHISHLANASKDTSAAMAILVKEVAGLVDRVQSLESPRINTELN